MRSEYTISSNDSEQTLHYVVWQPETPPVAILQLTHGMQEYILRYDGFAQAIVAHGWAVIGHDHLGHGQSGKWERGFFTEHPQGARILIDDIHLITALAKERWPGLPLFLFGHSMGSFFSRRYLAEYGKELSGAIICGSGWYPALATGTAYCASRMFGFFMGDHYYSKALATLCSLPFLHAFSDEGPGAWLSRNKKNVEQYKQDPLCGFHFTIGGYRFMYQNLMLLSRGYHHEQLQPIPLLVISGSDDPVGGTKGVQKIAAYYRGRGFCDVTEHLLPADRHEILFEDDAPSTIQYIAQWLNDHLKNS